MAGSLSYTQWWLTTHSSLPHAHPAVFGSQLCQRDRQASIDDPTHCTTMNRFLISNSAQQSSQLSIPEPAAPYRLAVVDSRSFTNQQYVDQLMRSFTAQHGMPSLIVSGGARGVDTLAERWTYRNAVPI